MFLEALETGRPLLLDAAMGTEILRRGGRTSLPLWSAWALLENPDLVLEIHRDEAAAGADILTANTFRTHRRTLEKAGLGARSEELTALAVSLARQAAAESVRPVFVAGSLSPLEDCYRPDLVPGEAVVLEREHARQAEALFDAGVDLILAETHNSVRELAAAARAAKGTGLPVLASMTTDGEGRLLSGEPVEEAVRALATLSLDVLSVNCVPASRLGGDLLRLATAAPGVPLGAYGNLGLPADDTGWTFTEGLPPEEYTLHAREWVGAGARLVGGCCGTTPAFTAAMRRLLDQKS